MAGALTTLMVLMIALSVRQLRLIRAHWLSAAYGLTMIASFAIIAVLTEDSAAELLEGSKRRLEHLIETQADFVLHQDAYWLAERIKPDTRLDTDSFKAMLADWDYDEYNIVDETGRVVASSAAETIGFDFASDPRTRPYLKLLDTDDGYVSEPYRASIGNPSEKEIKFGAVSMIGRRGIVQLGYSRQSIEEEFERFCLPIFDGFMKLFKEDYYIVAVTNGWKLALENGGHNEVAGKSISQIGLQPDSRHARLFGEWCHVGWFDIGNWRVFSVIPFSETYGEALVLALALTAALFALVLCFRLVMQKFRRQQAKIDAMRAEADARRREDMEMAAKIQSSSLPMSFPAGDDFVFSAKMEPAREVGGDFYDFIRLPDGRLYFAIADVSGKGVPAAMFMMKAMGVIKSQLFKFADLAAAVAEANDRLGDQNEAEMFVTAWIGVFDPKTREVEFVNAGHNPPLVRHRDGAIEWLRGCGGSALAVFPGDSYRAKKIALASGDALVLYTDGVTEAKNGAGEFFGEARLEAALAAGGGRRCQAVDAVFASVAAFAAGAEPADDITVLSLKVDSDGNFSETRRK